MPANPQLSGAQPPGAPPPAATSVTDTLFKRLVIASTALSLAAIYGWLAGFARQSNGDLSFHWRWPILLWVLIGLGTTTWFWRKIWPPAGQPDATRKDFVVGSVVVAIPGLWWLAFPLFSLSGQHLWDVIEGLTAAAIVLSFGAWAVIRLGRAFEENGNVESEPESQPKFQSPDSRDAGTKV